MLSLSYTWGHLQYYYTYALPSWLRFKSICAQYKYIDALLAVIFMSYAIENAVECKTLLAKCCIKYLNALDVLAGHNKFRCWRHDDFSSIVCIKKFYEGILLFVTDWSAGHLSKVALFEGQWPVWISVTGFYNNVTAKVSHLYSSCLVFITIYSCSFSAAILPSPHP